MKRKLLFVIVLVMLVLFIGGCKKSSDIPNPPEPPEPPQPPAPQEQQIGTMYYHDTGPQSQFDIFTAELFIVPKSTSTTAQAAGRIAVSAPGLDRRPMLVQGIHKLHKVAFKDKTLDRVVLSTYNAIDISEYDFEVRSVENITNSTSDDFAVNVNNNDWITFVTAPDGWATNRNNTEIVYMDLGDRVRHTLTPINNQYSGKNFDPDWKTESIIVWSHDGKIVEADINNLQIVSDSVVPEVDTSLFDPKYSPDGNKLLFNTRTGGKKNSYVKDLQSSAVSHILPDAYFNAYADDNPTWVFSNSLVTGHIFIDGMGRIYTLNLDDKTDFLIITDGSNDFRYVTPIDLDGDTYFIFSDWTDQGNITLWISNLNGTVLRALNQTGDEVVFMALGLPAPDSPEDMENIVRDYLEMFEY
jgi:hypothetical protein